MLDLGTLQLGIKVNGDAAKSELNQLGGAVEQTGSKTQQLAAKAKTMIKAFVAAYAIKEIVRLGKAAIDAYAQFEQLEGGVKKIFGKEAAAEVMKNAENAYKTAGMSANQYMETVTSFSASLISSMGGNSKEAAKVADMAIRDMSDNANTFGTNMQSIQDAYQGFAKQNYTMLDNLKLGYGGTKSEMERLLSDAEKLTGKKYDINNLNDVYEAIHAIQEEYNITGTTSKEAGKTIEGSVNSAKAAFDNLLTAIGGGKGVGKAMSAFVKALGTAAKNILPAMLNVIKGLVSGITSGLPALFEGVGAGKGFLIGLVKSIVKWIPQAISQIGQMLSDIADSIGKGGESKFGATAAKLVVALVKGLIQAIPSLIQGALKLILALQGALISYAGNLVKAGIEAMKKFIEGFLDAHPRIGKAVKTIGKVFSTVLRPVISIIKTVTKVWKKLMGQKGKKSFSVSAPFTKAIQAIKDVYDKWKDVLGQKAKKTFEAAKKGFTAVLDGMKKLYNKWKDILGQKASKTFTTTYKTKGKPSGKDGKGRLGIREVPYDGYVAELHKGEVVLTASETNQYKKYLKGLDSAASGIVQGISTANMMGNTGTTEARIVVNLGGAKVAEQVFRLNKQGKLAFEG